MIFSCFLFVGLSSKAQIKHYSYYEVSDGLSSNHVTDLAEASDGYIWLTTNGAGLTRYDGVTFENFTDIEEIGDLFYYSIYASENEVWFGGDNRLLKYASGAFHSYYIPALGSIKEIVRYDEEQLFCIGTLGAAFFSTKHGPVLQQSTAGLRFNCAINHEQILYAGTSKGLWSYNQGVWEKNQLVADFQLGNCLKITANMHGNLLVVDADHGLVKYSRDGLADILAEASDFPVQEISFMREGALGEIFLGTEDRGILIFQPHDSLWQRLDHSQLNFDDISNLIFDRWDNAWISTKGGGLVRFSSQNFTLYRWTELSGKYIERLELRTDTLFIDYRNSKRDKLYQGRVNPVVASRAEEEEIIGAQNMTASGHRWYATRNGLHYMFDSAHHKVLPRSSVDFADISRIVTVDSQRTYILNSGRIYQVDLIGIGEDHGPDFRDSLIMNGGIEELIVDADHRTWYFGPRKAGIIGGVMLDIQDRRVTSLLPIDGARLLMGTQNQGLHLFQDFDQANSGTELLVDGQSVPEVRALAVDKTGKVWLSLRNEVWELEITSNSKALIQRRYNEKVGWPRLETRTNALAVNRDGHVFVGTSAGIIEILPQSRSQAANNPVLSLVSIETKGRKFNRFDSSAVVFLRNLGAGFNDMEISLKAIDQKFPLGLTYFYQMDYHYNEWTVSKTGGAFHFLSLPTGPHLFRAKAVSQSGLESNVVEIPFRILQPVYYRWWFVLAAGILLLFFIWLFYRWRLNRQLLVSRKKTESLEMQNKMLRLEQEARRLQMNPHFIFNVLQSIQHKITSGYKDSARLDLQSFAKMMRSFLDHSRKDCITLEEEITLLSQYLKVEQELQSQAFTFHITLPENIDPSFVEIPSMLIQPFVENAVKHGLPSNGTPGKISVRFERRGKYLVCVVEDNGNGFGITNNGSHKSAGIEITRNRLHNFFPSEKIDPLIIENMLTESKKVIGAKVTIVLPGQV